MSSKCTACGKTAYPLESVTAQDKVYHKACFKCETCKTTLNLKNFKAFEGKIYCNTHTPKVKGVVITETVAMKSALNAPKKDKQSGVHKADSRVAPQHSGDFSVNQVGDQSTENKPEASTITYDAHHGDQSTENQPESSGITYEAPNPDQSTESEAQPEAQPEQQEEVVQEEQQ